MECLMRESNHRPSPSELARRTREGLALALAAAQQQPALPPNIATIPLVGLRQPEPPEHWTIDTSDFDLDVRDINTASTPTDSHRRGFLHRSLSGLSLFTSPRETGSGTAAPLPTYPRQATAAQRQRPRGSFHNLAAYFRPQRRR